MRHLLSVFAVAAAVTAGLSALYVNMQIDKLHRLRADTTQSAGNIDTAVGHLAGQATAVEARVKDLRAVAATPEMPVTGAELQAQIDRLLALQAQASEMAADDPAAAAVAAAADLRATAQATLDAFRQLPARDAFGAALEAGGAADQILFEVTIRSAVAQSEGLARAMAFDPWDNPRNPEHYLAATYDAAAVADNITFSELTAAQKTSLRAALAAAEGDETALQAVLDRVASALGITQD